MYATLLSALVLAQAPTPGQPAPPPVQPTPPAGLPGQPGQPAPPVRPIPPAPTDRAPIDRAPAATASLDGSWTVLYCSKDGQDQAAMKDKTITIRNNVATVTGEGAEQMKSMRLEPGPNGTIRVTDLDAADRPAPGAPGAERPATPGAERPAAPGAAQPGTPSAGATATKTGVCVHGGDYMSLALYAPAAGGVERRPVEPGAAPTPLGADRAAPADRMTEKPAFVIFLKRAGDSTAPGGAPGIEPRR